MTLSNLLNAIFVCAGCCTMCFVWLIVLAWLYGRGLKARKENDMKYRYQQTHHRRTQLKLMGKTPAQKREAAAASTQRLKTKSKLEKARQKKLNMNRKGR